MFFNKIVFSFFILFFPLIISAQDEPAPLIEKMKSAKGNEKVDLLNKISAAYRKSDRYASMKYAQQAYELSVSENYIPGRALAKKNEGICWFFIGSNDSAALCYSQALEDFIRIQDNKGMSACYNNLGLIAQETGKYDEALKLYQHSIDMDRKLGDEIGVAQTMENIADINLYRGNVKKAISLTNQCISIYTRLSYKPGLLASYINKGAEFEYMMKYKEAILEYAKAIKLARELEDVYYEIVANSNMGVMYWHLDVSDSAMKYLNIALGMSDENDDAYNIDNTLNTIAQIYTSQEKYAEANDILQRILKRNEEIENKRKAASIMTAIGRNLIELNEIDKSLAYLNKSLEITTRLNSPYEMIDNYRNLAYANAILHNFKEADSLQDLFASTYSRLLTSDSLTGSVNSKITQTEPNKEITSTLTDWIIAFSMMLCVVILSVIAYQGKKSA
jgi:tetratricopeptide (TPR) repeat protein